MTEIGRVFRSPSAAAARSAPIADPPIEPAQHLGSAARQWRPRNAPGTQFVAPGCEQAVARHRGVGCDDAGQVQFDGQVGDVVDVEVEGLGRLSNKIVEGPTPVREDVGAQPTESEEVISTAMGGDWEHRGKRAAKGEGAKHYESKLSE